MNNAQEVWVYRNLKHGRKARPLYSIRQNGRVVGWRHRVLLTDARFVVNETGRQRVLREGQKNVHAFVIGTLVNSGGAFGIDENGPNLPIRVTYNPYTCTSFVYEAGPLEMRAAVRARGVLLNEAGITACYLEDR